MGTIVVPFFASSFHIVEAFVPFVMKKEKRKEKAHATDREILGSRRVQRTKNLKEKKKKERKNCENIT